MCICAWKLSGISLHALKDLDLSNIFLLVTAWKSKNCPFDQNDMPFVLAISWERKGWPGLKYPAICWSCVIRVKWLATPKTCYVIGPPSKEAVNHLKLCWVTEMFLKGLAKIILSFWGSSRPPLNSLNVVWPPKTSIWGQLKAHYPKACCVVRLPPMYLGGQNVFNRLADYPLTLTK